MSGSRSTSRLWRTVAACAVAGGVLWLADSLLAMRVEASLSEKVEQVAQLETSPDVFVGGFPYSLAILTGKVPVIGVNSLDIRVEGLGIVNARTEVAGIDATASQVLRGDFAGAPGELYKRVISLDGVAFGQLLDLTDLDISNPYDISPSGGVASEAQLRATPAGFAQPVSAIVTLRLVGSEFQMRPIEVLEAPEGRAADVIEAFTFTMDTRELPLSQQASLVQVAGGSIQFETQRTYVTVDIADLTPLDSASATDPETAHW